MTAGMEVKMNRQSNQITALYIRIGKPGSPMMAQAQAELLKRFAQEKGLENTHLYCDDGFSGVTCNRPAFRSLIHDIVHGKVAKLLVADMGRLHRNVAIAYYLVKYFLPRYHVQILSSKQEETDPHALALLMGLCTPKGGVE